MGIISESRLLECRRCGAGNRVPLERAFAQPGGLRCGRCKQGLLLDGDARWSPPPMREHEGAVYAHPLDRQTLEAVQQIPGVDTLIKKLIEHTFERYYRLLHQTSYVKAGDGQLDTLHGLFRNAAHRLGIDELPDLYLLTDPNPNAYCAGVEKPFVAITSGLVDMMDNDEVGAVMAHELAHWQCKHVLYRLATRLLVQAAEFVASMTMGLSNLLALPVRLALLKWDRCSELSADRGMLIATRDPMLSMRVLFKLAGSSTRMAHELSLERFIEQADRARQAPEEALLDRVYSVLQTMNQTHPFPLWRAAELWRWACDGDYLTIIQQP